MERKPSGLSIDIAVTNAQPSSERPNNTSYQNSTFYHDGIEKLDSSITTYRAEGLSIGQDYFRFENHTTISPSPKDLIIEGIIGMGASSVVKLARYQQMGHDQSNDSIKSPSFSSVKPLYYALKIFPLHREANRTDAVSCLYNDNGFANEDDTATVAIRRQSGNKKRSMLIQEIKTLSQLHCDCLVEMVGAFHDPGVSVTMVLEYMDHGSLADMLGFNSLPDNLSDEINYNSSKSLTSPLVRDKTSRKTMMPEAALAAVAYQMLWGISYLHLKKILHRDIKPANVLVHSSGRVKLGDLGISGAVGCGNTSTDMSHSGLNHTVIGTTRYMSPERVLDRAYGTPSDIWSFGLVLLECATGGWSPFSVYDDNDENTSSGYNSSRPGPKHRKGVRSIIELAVVLEEFSISSVLERLSHREQFSLPERSDEVNWSAELNKENGICELLTICLQASPEKRAPSDVLLDSPWFKQFKADGVDNAVIVMHKFLQDFVKN